MLTLNRNKIHIHSARFLRLAQISKLLIPLQYHRQCFALSNLASTTPCVKHFNNPFKLNWMFNEAEGAEMALCLPYGTGWCRYLPYRNSECVGDWDCDRYHSYLKCIIMYCTVLCNTIEYYTMLYYTILYCSSLCCIM